MIEKPWARGRCKQRPRGGEGTYQGLEHREEGED